MRVVEDTDSDGEHGWFVEDDQGKRIAGLFYTKISAEKWIKWVKGHCANYLKAEALKGEDYEEGSSFFIPPPRTKRKH